MEPPKPKCSIEELRTINPVAYQIFQIIVTGLIQKYWRNLVFKNSGIGLEGTLEAIEGLIDKGYLKVGTDDENFFFLIWDSINRKYSRPPI